MPLTLSDYASPIESAWLAIIFPVSLYPLSLGRGQCEGR
jgi:hypothetical protein